MGGLGDHPTAKHTDSNRVRGLFHGLSNYGDFARVCQPRDIDTIVTDSANEDLRRICRDWFA